MNEINQTTIYTTIVKTIEELYLKEMPIPMLIVRDREGNIVYTVSLEVSH